MLVHIKSKSQELTKEKTKLGYSSSIDIAMHETTVSVNNSGLYRKEHTNDARIICVMQALLLFVIFSKVLYHLKGLETSYYCSFSFFF